MTEEVRGVCVGRPISAGWKYLLRKLDVNKILRHISFLAPELCLEPLLLVT